MNNTKIARRDEGEVVETVNEPGLYRLIFMSQKMEAKQFQRWVLHEVLPSIRRTGRYEASPEEMQAFAKVPEGNLSGFLAFFVQRTKQ